MKVLALTLVVAMLFVGIGRQVFGARGQLDFLDFADIVSELAVDERGWLNLMRAINVCIQSYIDACAEHQSGETIVIWTVGTVSPPTIPEESYIHLFSNIYLMPQTHTFSAWVIFDSIGIAFQQLLLFLLIAFMLPFVLLVDIFDMLFSFAYILARLFFDLDLFVTT